MGRPVKIHEIKIRKRIIDVTWMNQVHSGSREKFRGELIETKFV